MMVAGGAVCSGPVVGGVGSVCGAVGTCEAGGCWAHIGKLANAMHAIAAKPGKAFRRQLEEQADAT